MESSRLQDFAQMSVLMVDDDPVSAFLAGEYLESLGFKVEVLTDGATALARMEAALPDLVICDRLMPGLSGVDLLETIRSRGPQWQAVGFVFLTALTDRRDRYAMLPLRPDGYICKPIQLAKFDAELVEILLRRRRRMAAEAAAATSEPGG